MPYTTRKGRRPSEYASKVNHGHFINDLEVQQFLQTCDYPFTSDEIELDEKQIVSINPEESGQIDSTIAIDGSWQEIPVKKHFPSSTITFFQTGALYLSMKLLDDLYIKPFLEPKDIAKMREIQRYKFVLPTKNVISGTSSSLTDSIREALHNYFSRKQEDDTSFIETLNWFLFRGYDKEFNESWDLAWCPTCHQGKIEIRKELLDSNHTLDCPYCGAVIYLTDTFRLHEVIDDDLGASGIISYLGSVLEQVIIIHLIKLILETKPTLLNEILFIKDGSLAFYGQTANLHKPMRALVGYLFDNYNLYLVGLEKTGAFVEHADEIAKKLKPGSALLLNNSHIYTYIKPGRADDRSPHGGTTYYGQKVIFRALDDRVYVATLASREVLSNPSLEDIPNLSTILHNVQKLKCDMYDSALIPVSLANKLVSLANRPSSLILEKFAKKSIAQK